MREATWGPSCVSIQCPTHDARIVTIKISTTSEQYTNILDTRYNKYLKMANVISQEDIPHIYNKIYRIHPYLETDSEQRDADDKGISFSDIHHISTYR